jgi:prephenate dehydrogenase
MEQVVIIGLGLIGGSLGLALKQANVPEMEIVGVSRRPETVSQALSIGAIDRGGEGLAPAVSKASVVIIATPLLAIRDILQQIAPHLPPHSLVTDVGSTKMEVMGWAGEFLPPTVDFIGGHPMTGKETFGLDEAEARLFQGCVYCLTPAANANSQAVQRATELVHLIGSRPLFIDAAEHDRLVAAVSHLPILLSAALVSASGDSPSWAGMSKLAATGYRDLSRLASGNPEMSRDICLTNRANIIDWLDRYMEELRKYRRLMLENEGELMAAFIRAREIHQRWLREYGTEG